jgi:hypothetical protein
MSNGNFANSQATVAIFASHNPAARLLNLAELLSLLPLPLQCGKDPTGCHRFAVWLAATSHFGPLPAGRQQNGATRRPG